MAPTEPTVQTLTLLRHGETQPNLDGVRCGGDRDPPLTERGRDQMRACGPALRVAGLRPARVITAPLRRTRESAGLIAEAVGCPVLEDAGLIERRLGVWNGRPIVETEAMLKAGETPPGGEAEAAFRERVAAALARLLSRREPEVLILTSKGVMRVGLLWLTGESWAPAANAEPVTLDRTAGGIWRMRA